MFVVIEKCFFLFMDNGFTSARDIPEILIINLGHLQCYAPFMTTH